MDLRLTFSCPLNWGELRGEGAIRHCRLCNRSVPDLSTFTAAEARAFLKAQGGPMCARLLIDARGRLITLETLAVAGGAAVIAGLSATLEEAVYIDVPEPSDQAVEVIEDRAEAIEFLGLMGYVDLGD